MEVPDEWTTGLAEAIATSLRQYAPQLGESEVALLTVICLPWHGLLSMALLTAEELAEDARLADPRTTMDWQHGELTEDVEGWGQTTPLAEAMRTAYDSSPDRPASARAFLDACARAVATPTVAEAIGLLRCTGSFRISVPHPDDGHEFFPPTTP